MQRLEASERNITWAMDHWIDHTLGSFFTEFAIDRNISDSEAKCRLFKGPQGKYLKSLKTWIKFFLCDKRVMQLPCCLGLREVGNYLEEMKTRAQSTVHLLNPLQVTTKGLC